MPSQWRTFAICVVALLLGFFVSFFTAGPALFADGDFSERPPLVIISAAVFLLLGFLGGLLAWQGWKAVGVTLAVSAIPVPLFFGLAAWGTPAFVLLAAAFLLADAAAAVFGAWLGVRRHLRHAVR